MKPLTERVWDYVTTTDGDGCWLWRGTATGKGNKARGRIVHNRRVLLAHRVTYELTSGPIPDGMLLLHRCGNGMCVRPDHLYPGTYQDNANDRDRHGNTTRGDRCHSARLTPVRVAEIRSRHADGESMRSLGRAFGVTRQAIRAVVSGRTWKHV